MSVSVVPAIDRYWAFIRDSMGRMSTYERPTRNLHRGFFYLDDEVVVNSLSSFEAGKVDEVVSKAVVAREGGGALGASLGLGALSGKAEVSKKGSTTMEEEITKTRTRFSIFHLWHEQLRSEKAIGQFSDWGNAALVDVSPGDTVTIRARLDVVPIYGLMRMFLWYADKAAQQGHPLSQKGEELKSTKEASRNIKMLLGDEGVSKFTVFATPLGDPGPAVAMELDDRWLIGNLGALGGVYTIVAQVQRILNVDDWMLTMRLFSEGPVTELERQTVRTILTGFKEAGETFNVNVSPEDGEIHGPAVWLEPIAIFR